MFGQNQSYLFKIVFHERNAENFISLTYLSPTKLSSSTLFLPGCGEYVHFSIDGKHLILMPLNDQFYYIDITRQQILIIKQGV